MEQLLSKAIYEIEDDEAACDALWIYAIKLEAYSPEWHYFVNILEKVLNADLCDKDMDDIDDILVINALRKIHLRCSINLILRKARRVE